MTPLRFSDEVRAAQTEGRPLVALESTVIAHGLPYPENLDLARAQQAVIRAAGAVPATIGLLAGRIVIGLSDAEIEHFATDRAIAKVSRRDFAQILASGKAGATTVAGTMIAAAMAGIALFATGGIGGVHRGGEQSLDISADLTELGRTPVAVVSSGAKLILDLPRTLEVLETHGVPVLGYGVDQFPGFYCRSVGLPVPRLATAAEAARLIKQQLSLGLGGLLIANPVPEADALPRALVESWIAAALDEATAQGIGGAAVTPFLLQRLAQLSAGRASTANRALLIDNARVAAEIAVAMRQ